MKRVSVPVFRRIVFFSALYDLLVTLSFATPWSFALVRQQLSSLNQVLGGASLPSFEGFHLLLANLMGSIVVMWSVLRLRHPEPLLGRYDGAGRFVFAGWMAWTLHVTGAPVLWLFVLPELAWGIAQWWPLAGAATLDLGAGRSAALAG